MNVKYIRLESILNNKIKTKDTFILNLEKELKTKLICTTDFKDYDCDLKLIYVKTGGSENIFLKNFKYLKKPYIFITSGTNNSLAASLEILHYLHLKNLSGEILHGDFKYIANRIKELCKKVK